MLAEFVLSIVILNDDPYAARAIGKNRNSQGKGKSDSLLRR